MISKFDIIRMHRDTNTKAIKDTDGTIHVQDYAITEGTVNMMSTVYIKADEGNFASASTAFIETFVESINALDEAGEKRVINIEKHRTRNGREYRIAVPACI